MKKIIILLAITALLVLAGCAVQEPEQDPLDKPPAPEISEEQQAFEDEMRDEMARLQQEAEARQEEPVQEEVSHTEYQQEPTISQTIPASFKLTMPKLTIDCYKEVCLDYLGAYTMAARYYNKGIDLTSVAGYGMVGSNAKFWNNQDIDNDVGETAMIIASNNYGFDYVLGLGRDGIASLNKYQLKFEDNAAELVYANNKDDALEKMKKAVSSRYPVIVYLDVSYLQNDFAKYSSFWNSFPGEKKGHFMIVTGYGNDNIYLNDPNDVSSENIPAPVDNFLLAWAATNFLNERKLGPFWMMYLKRSSERKLEEELLIEQNNAASSKALVELNKFATQGMKTDASCSKLAVLAKTRDLYSNFLERHEIGMSSSMYKDSADFLRYACEEGINQNVQKAATKEENAQSAI